jgi:hypothetical protein
MWTPIDLERLYDRINRGDAAMDQATRRLWNVIRVEPEKWQLHPWGDMGGGFWVVGVIGRYALWFNDIEDGFNISRYEKVGVLFEYCCDQEELNWAVCAVQHMINDGDVQGRFGPPQPVPQRPDRPVEGRGRDSG